MDRTARWAAGAALAVTLVASGAGIAGAAGGAAGGAPGGEDASETPISGSALDQASAAALAHTGGGRVTGTEIGDEEGFYEVEVTLDGGGQVDVHLDERFAVIGQERDGAKDEEGTGDDGAR